VVLPAGGRISGAFAARAGTTVKALISLGGRSVLAATVQRLRDTGRVGRIVAVGPPEVIEEARRAGVDAALTDTGHGAANIRVGLEWLRDNCEKRAERVLVMTTDLPLATPAAICGFLDAVPAEADIAVPAIERHEFAARFPDLRETYVVLADGEWMIGCTVLMRPERILARWGLVRRAFDSRKNMALMASLLGPVFVLRLLFRRLTVPQVERRCCQMLRCNARAVYGCAPELGFDIDKPHDYEYAAKHLPT
jgi:hypothetical protein